MAPASAARRLIRRPQSSSAAYRGLALCLLAANTVFYLSFDDVGLSDIAFGQRFLSSIGSLSDVEEYSHMSRSSDIDPSIEARALANDDPNKCSRMFLYLPNDIQFHGHGSQFQPYVRAALSSTYLDRAMVLVEPLSKSLEAYPAGGSQFGCPVDAFRETVTKTSVRTGSGKADDEIREDFPSGFSRLVRNPGWLSRGCPVPCADTHGYRDWVALAQNYMEGGDLKEITCTNPDGVEVNVVAMAPSKFEVYLSHLMHDSVSAADGERLKRWATNLGASEDEAQAITGIPSTGQEIWDYALGLANKAGFLGFQPWIARDVQLFLQSSDLPLDEEYSGIHVRRGDKLKKESLGEVKLYWKKLGYKHGPTNYVPFVAYLNRWDPANACPRDYNGDVKEVTKHNVYVATDDPLVVQREIAELPNHIDNDNSKHPTVLWNDCHELTFYFNPTNETHAFHINGDGEHGLLAGDSCFARYERSVTVVADIMVLAKARTFIGEYNSNLGRVIRTGRVRVNDMNENHEESAGVSLARVLDTRIAWGDNKVRGPGA